MSFALNSNKEKKMSTLIGQILFEKYFNCLDNNKVNVIHRYINLNADS